MLSLATERLAPQRPAMDDEIDEDAREQSLLGNALTNLRNATGLSQPKAAVAYEDAGFGPMSPQNWSKYERGKAPTILQPSVRRKLAEAVGADRATLDEERDRLAEDARWAGSVIQRPLQAKALFVRDRVQAGAWLAADDFAQRQPREYPAIRDDRYPYAEQWLSEVVGDSVNKLGIRDGDLIHCINAIDINYLPRTGNIVEVERTRFGGQERELTVKQIEVTPGGILLWPRSTNPAWTTPLQLTDSLQPDATEVRIRAWVARSIHPFDN